MPKYHVEKSIVINAPVDDVLPLTRDYNQWPAWSPWLCMEPDATVQFHGTPGEVGHGYSWSGELVGAGEMHTTAHEGTVHNMDLKFLKPFKSTATVSLDIQPVGEDKTNVTWHMWSAMPFFLFFMTRTIKNMIGMDYERGLKMLKEQAETGKVNSKLEIAGVVDIPETHYVGLTAECPVSDISASMKNTMPRVDSHATEQNLQRTDIPAGSIYNKMNLKNGECVYTSIIPVKQPATSSAEVTHGTINAGKAIKVTHRGSYSHLGNGWATAMAFQRYKKHKPLKSQPPYELYLNDPRHTEEQDLVTEIYIPVRG